MAAVVVILTLLGILVAGVAVAWLLVELADRIENRRQRRYARREFTRIMGGES